MGTLRFLLALSVIIAHSSTLFGISMVGGPTAVQTFYMISGFYMSLILEKKYTGIGSYQKFLSNRFLRIFPVYWIIAALTLIFLSLTGGLVIWTQIGVLPFLFLSFVNTLIIGQDVVMFLKFTPDLQGFLPTKNFWITSPPTHNWLLIPQAWSISVELLFYVVAPWLVRKTTRILVVLACLSLILRAMLYAKGLDFDPWTYRFFPLELFFFITGILCFRYFRRIKERILEERTWIFCLTLALAVVFYQFIPTIIFPRQILLYAAIILSLPFLFIFTNTHRWDRSLGELSYPAYISHYLILQILFYFRHETQATISQTTTLLCIVLTLLVSGLLVRFVSNPIDNFRQRRV
ncbi:MAG: acyltransferase [Candidatus Woesebacteria bacterium]